MSRILVKVCGITSREDALAAVDAGADVLGFNFYAASPRCITPDTAAELGAGLPVLKAGVFVDASPATVTETVATADLDIIQLHGSEAAADYPQPRIWKAVRVTNGWTPGSVDAGSAEAVLLDGPAPGSGQSFDWNLASQLPWRVVLAGGLGPDNVAESVRRVRPWGVDACSRLEGTPGRKDHHKMRRLIEAVREVSL